MPANIEYKILINGNPLIIIEDVNSFITANGGTLKTFGPVYGVNASPARYYAIIEYKP